MLGVVWWSDDDRGCGRRFPRVCGENGGGRWCIPGSQAPPLTSVREGRGQGRSTMSAGCHRTQSRAIPTRRVTVSDAAQLPPDYSSTPGGTLFSTTPGGTRIIYDRKFLMECRNSPVAKTPPRDLPNIPGVTSPNTAVPKVETNHVVNHEEKHGPGEDAQFQMDI